MPTVSYREASLKNLKQRFTFSTQRLAATLDGIGNDPDNEMLIFGGTGDKWIGGFNKELAE